MNISRTRRFTRLTVVFGILMVVGLLSVRAPAQANAQERAANLRAQLVEVEATQAELQNRLQQLDEELKPENIERSLAGVGSVHPEDLREARRRQLEIEKRGVQSQLETLAANHTRLEAAVSRADSESYLESAGVNPVTGQTLTPQPSSARPRKKAHRNTRRVVSPN